MNSFLIAHLLLYYWPKFIITWTSMMKLWVMLLEPALILTLIRLLKMILLRFWLIRRLRSILKDAKKKFKMMNKGSTKRLWMLPLKTVFQKETLSHLLEYLLIHKTFNFLQECLNFWVFIKLLKLSFHIFFQLKLHSEKQCLMSSPKD